MRHIESAYRRTVGFFSNIMFLFRIVWHEIPRDVTGFGVAHLIVALSAPLNPYLLKLVFDGLATIPEHLAIGKNVSVLPLFIPFGLFILTQLGHSSIKQVMRVKEAIISSHLRFAVGVKVMTQAAVLNVAYFEDPKTHDKISHISEKTTAEVGQILPNFFELLGDLISLTALASLIAMIGAPFFIMMIVVTAPSIILAFKQGDESHQWEKDWRRLDRVADYYERMTLSPRCVQELRVFGLQALFRDRFADATQRYLRGQRMQRIRNGKYDIAIDLFPTLGNMACIGLLLFYAVAGKVTTGDIIMFMAAFGNISVLFARTFQDIGRLYTRQLYLDDLTEFLNLEPRIVTRPDARIVTREEPLTIEFDHVSFRYPDNTCVLRDVSFTLQPGQHVALVGNNGAGKSTLLKLLLRLYDPIQGRILVNGTDLRDIDLGTYHARIGPMFQDPIHYDAKLREHIGFGDVKNLEDGEAISRAAQLGHVDEIAAALPETYETYVGEENLFDNSHRLSGGQKQRIALARAFMKNDAAFIILDEPTSHLDAEKERTFFEEMKKTITCGVIYISHRFSTVRQADHIIVLSDGRVIEEGSHDELMRQNGRYAELFQSQADLYLA